MTSPDQSRGWIPEGAGGGAGGFGGSAGAGAGAGAAGGAGSGAGAGAVVTQDDAAATRSAEALTDLSRQCGGRRGVRIAGRRTVQKSPPHASGKFAPSG